MHKIRILLCAGLLLAVCTGFSQEAIRGSVIDSLTGEPITDFMVRDKKAHHLLTLPGGRFSFTAMRGDTAMLAISALGYHTKNIHFLFAAGVPDSIIITLSPSFAEIGEVIVQSTRTNRNLDEVPTRIEAIAGEELEEKATMKPGDIRMLLNESTGINTQTTSAVSGLASLRIQGLDGRYTQILKDGMPLYNGFSGGLGILQIAPLDLKQVEYIKGSVSTIYGGGAIAGLVNLITRTPSYKPELSLLLNANSGKGADAAIFYGARKKKTGVTIYGAWNHNGIYDPAGIGFTAIPQTSRVTLNPKIFFYPGNRVTAWFGVNTTFETRRGGDLNVLNGAPDNTHRYFEYNQTRRLSTQMSLVYTIDPYRKLAFKNSIGFLNRSLEMPGFRFNGDQWSSFSEASYLYHRNGIDWVAGLNEWTEDFYPRDSTKLRYHQSTIGAFVQNTYRVTDAVAVESGIRLDHSSPGTKNHPGKLYLLPRVNVLVKWSSNLSSRMGGGFGYKMPTPFTDEAEKIGYRNLVPLTFQWLNTEQSYGLNADINYKARFNELTVSVNQLFFYSRLNDPILLQGNLYVNANGYLDTRGAETNLKLGLGDFSVYLGYAYTNAVQHYNGTAQHLPLTPKHKLNADLMFEIENSFRCGLELYYTGKQDLTGGATGREYLTMGLLVQKTWKGFSVFINGENITDQRQTLWGHIYTGSIGQPAFTDIYAPLDGRIINVGVKVTLR
ncbi:MAG: collagen-binding protein [Sediminibacterium sp.]|nr:collagen-binding protein [Sediminibacterium sp.]